MSGSVNVYLFNNCEEALIGGYFLHQSGSGPTGKHDIAGPLNAGELTGPLHVEFTSSLDWWIVQVELKNGKKYISNGGSWKECAISSKHDNKHCVVLMASEHKLTITMDSGPCQTGMKEGSKAFSDILPPDESQATEGGGKCTCP